MENTNKIIESNFYGITIKKDTKQFPKNELTLEYIKQLPIISIDLLSAYADKNNYKKELFSFYVYPCIDKQNTILTNHKQYCKYFCLNDDNSIKFTKNELTIILLSLNKEFNDIRYGYNFKTYGRFITEVNPYNNKRYYGLQIIFKNKYTKNLFFREIDLLTASLLIEKGYIEPLEFIETYTNEFDFENLVIQKLNEKILKLEKELKNLKEKS